MNGSDAVDLALDLFRGRAMRIAIFVFLGLLAVGNSQATRAFYWYVNEKTQGIVESVTSSIQDNVPAPVPVSQRPTISH